MIYSSHDLDDGLDAGLLSEDKIARTTCAFSPKPLATVRAEHGELPAEIRRYFIIRCIIDLQVRDVVETSEAAILASGVKTADDVRRQPRPLIRSQSRPAGLERGTEPLPLPAISTTIPAVAEPNRRAGKMLEELFRVFCRSIPRKLASPRASAPAKSAGIAPFAITSPA